MPAPTRQPRTARKRLIVAAAIAVLTVGGSAACGTEEPTVTKAPTADAGKGGEGKSGEKSGENAEDAEDGKAAESGTDGPLSAGDTATYDSGLGITVSAAKPYAPNEFAVGHTEGNKAHKVTVTLENNGDTKIDISLITLSARAGENGVTAEQIFDGEVGSGFDGKLLPGKKATAEYAFDAPASAKNLDVEVDLLDFTSEPVQWSLTL